MANVSDLLAAKETSRVVYRISGRNVDQRSFGE
jgi:hypothetical protein